MINRKKTVPVLIILINFLLYISLGLPDAVMGSAWPILRLDFGLDLSAVGYLTMIGVVFSFLSTLVYPRLARKLTSDQFMFWSMISVLIGLTFLIAGNAVPLLVASCAFLGMGQGAIDIAVNNFAAKHFSSGLMSVLHGCYGVGITLSSLIIAMALDTDFSWRGGVILIGILQLVILVVFFMNRGHFREKDEREELSKEKIRFGKLDVLMIAFYFTYALEVVIGNFLSSYLVDFLAMPSTLAATMATIYWGGLMVGRFVTGITTRLLSDKTVLFLHLFLTCGAVSLLYIQHDAVFGLASFLLGFGLSAVYPLMMMVPYKLYSGAKATQAVSFNVAGCQAGIVVLPIVFGIGYEQIGLQWFPPSILLCGVVMIVIASIVFKKL